MTKQKPPTMTPTVAPTLTQKIICHRGFIPVVFLLFLSVLISGLARFSDYTQRGLDTNGVQTIATVTKVFTDTSKRSGNLGGTKIRHFMILQYVLKGDRTFNNRVQISLAETKTIKPGDTYNITYNPNQPKQLEVDADEYGRLADLLRLFAWLIFTTATLLASHHFLQTWLAQRRRR